MHRVDYDEVAHLYDEPERGHAVDANLLAPGALFFRAPGYTPNP